MDHQLGSRDRHGYAENWIAEYGDSLTAILCMNDGMAGGAIQALEGAGLAGKVLVCGQDCDLLACQRIVQGTQVSTVAKAAASIRSSSPKPASSTTSAKRPRLISAPM